MNPSREARVGILVIVRTLVFLSLLVPMFGVSAYPQSVRPDEVVSSAIANYYLDLQMLPNYVCDITMRDTRGTTAREQELIMGGKLYVWSYIPQLDGSWELEVPPTIEIDQKEAPWVDPSYVGRRGAQAFTFRDIPALFRPQTVREDQLDNRAVWVIELKARSHVKWPADLPRFHMVQMWVDQQSRRMLRLVFTGVGKRAEYVFRTPSPGFITQVHGESVDGSFLNRSRKHSTIDRFLSYRLFDVSTSVSLP